MLPFDLADLIKTVGYIGLFAIVFLQVGLGYTRRHWLHVPVGVGLFGGLLRQANRLDTLWRATGAQS